MVDKNIKNKLLAPNGQPSNLTPEQYHLVRTPAFIKWFGNWLKAYETKDYTGVSKVIDENGEPMVVFHGTKYNFNQFLYEKINVGDNTTFDGFFFTNNLKYAKQFGNIKICFLNIKYPIIIKNGKSELLNKKIIDNLISERIKNNDVDDDFSYSPKSFLNDFYGKGKIKTSYGQLNYILKYIYKNDIKSLLIKLIELNIDGIVRENNDYIAFNPNQIKLADGSNTTFDVSNPDIRFKNGGNIDIIRLYHGTTKENLIKIIESGYLAPHRSVEGGGKEVWFSTIPDLRYGDCKIYIDVPRDDLSKLFMRANETEYITNKPVDITKYNFTVKKIGSFDLPESIEMIKERIKAEPKAELRYLDIFGSLYDMIIAPLLQGENPQEYYKDWKINNFDNGGNISKKYEISPNLLRDIDVAEELIRAENEFWLMKEAKIINGVTLTKAFRPFYTVIFDTEYSSGSNDIQEFINLEDAYEYANEAKYECRNCNNYKTIDLFYQEIWIDDDHNVVEELKMYDYYELSKINGTDLILDIIGNETLLYKVDFGGSEDDAEELLYEVRNNLCDDIRGEKINISDWEFTIEVPTKCDKYSNISIYFGEKFINDIKLRISDHAYNPANNYLSSDGFISVEIANKNLTKDKWHGSYSLQYDADADYDVIKFDVLTRISEIISSWDLDELTKENNSMNTGGKIPNFEITAEDMLNKAEIKKDLQAFGDKNEITNWVEQFHAQTKNYAPYTYYHVVSDGGYAGVGNGLYLGRDKSALCNFYDVENTNKKIIKYIGKPKWLDLIESDKFYDFKNKLKKQKIDIVNSDKVGEIVKEMGFDGIRYYDSNATGEEFVLFNTNKVVKVNEKNCNEIDIANLKTGGKIQDDIAKYLVAEMDKNEYFSLLNININVSNFYRGIANNSIPYDIIKLKPFDPRTNLTRVYDEIIQAFKDKKTDWNKPIGILLNFKINGESQGIFIDGNHRMFRAFTDKVESVKVFYISDIDTIKRLAPDFEYLSTKAKLESGDKAEENELTEFKQGGYIMKDKATQITDDKGAVKVEGGQAIVNAHNAQQKDHKHEFDGAQLTHLEIISLINQQTGGKAMTGNKAEITNDARQGGVFSGQKHSECSDKGCGIKGVVVDTNTHIEVEDKEPIIKKESVQCNCTHTFDGKTMTNKEILTAINTEGGWGVPIYDKGGDVMKNGGGIDNGNYAILFEDAYLNKKVPSRIMYGINDKEICTIRFKGVKTVDKKNYLYVSSVATDKEFENKGCATRIYEFAIKKAKEYGFDGLYSETVINDKIYSIAKKLNAKNVDKNIFWENAKNVMHDGGGIDNDKMILYHVSEKDFDKFDENFIQEIGFHFFDNKDFVKRYFKKGIIYTVEVPTGLKQVYLPFDMNRWSIENLKKNYNTDINDVEIIKYKNHKEFIFNNYPLKSEFADSYIVLNPDKIKIISKEHLGTFYHKGGKVSKEGYERKREYAAAKNYENRKIQTLTDEQHDALANLAHKRHEFHINLDKITRNDEYGFKNELEKANIILIESGLPKMDFIPNDLSDFIDIDSINDLLLLGDDIPDHDSVDYQKWYDDNYYRIYSELEELNRKIENYLLEIDKKYGTNYSPTGLSRIMQDGGGLSRDGGLQGETGDEVAVFKSEQIKLADGSNTTFDGNNPDIRFEDGGGVDNEETIDVYDYQDSHGERIVSKSWNGTAGNYWRYKFENAGDILRELSKYKNNSFDTGYIYEKVGKIDDFIKKITERYVHPDDTYSQMKSDNLQNILDLSEAYTKQPVKSKAQEQARLLVLALLNNDLKTSKEIIDYFNSFRGNNDRSEVTGLYAENIIPVSNMFTNGGSITDSQAFKKWFGNSKVVDEKGNPLVVYHGTINEFNIFKYSADLGFHFGTLAQASQAVIVKSTKIDPELFMELPIMEGGQRGYILPCYLSIQNPFEMSDWITWDAYVIAKWFLMKGIFTQEEFNQIKGLDFNDAEKKFVEMLIEKGYDGIKYENVSEGEGTSWIAFKPEQIKLADGTNTTFDPNNPDIRYNDGGSVNVMEAVETKLLAPNGQPSILNPEQYKLVRTPEFKAWFGDWERAYETKDYTNVSKMVDDNSEPLVCYHGTNSNFTVFRDDVGHYHDMGFYGQGFYFTFQKDIAYNKFSIGEAGYYGNKIIPAFINTHTPFDMGKLSDYKGVAINIVGTETIVFLYNIAKMFPQIANEIFLNKKTYNQNKQEYDFEKVPISVLPDLIEKYQKELKIEIINDSKYDKQYYDGYVKSKMVSYDYTEIGGGKDEWLEHDWLSSYSRYDIKTNLKELEIMLIKNALEKYDGLDADYYPEGYMTRYPIITDTIKKNHDSIIQGESGDEIAVFNPEQIKLADGSNTTFDGNNPDIRFNEGGNIDKQIWQMTLKEYLETVHNIEIPKEIILKADPRSSFKEIKFISKKGKQEYPKYKAVKVNLDNTENNASSSDIAETINKPFFQNETQEIGRKRLVLFLKGYITDYLAQVGAFNDSNDIFYASHYNLVNNALSQGLPVPKEVVNDYPNLKEKYSDKFVNKQTEYKNISVGQRYYDKRYADFFEVTNIELISEGADARITQKYDKGAIRTEMASGINYNISMGQYSIEKTFEQQPEKGKEVWQMTQNEYALSVLGSKSRKGEFVYPEDASNSAVRIAENIIHKRAIEQALSEGKPVPKNVLNEYLELKQHGEGNDIDKSDFLQKKISAYKKLLPIISADKKVFLEKKIKAFELLVSIKNKQVEQPAEKNDYTVDEIRDLWGNGKPLTYKGKQYSVNKMSYGDYFLEPYGKVLSERDNFDDDTIWLQLSKDEKHYLIGQYEDVDYIP